jgi:hypothetical protein
MAEKEKHPGGAPTKYDQEVIDKAEDYLENFHMHDQVVPTVAGLSLHIGMSRRSVYGWADQEDKPEFLHILNRLMAKQELLLVNKGLSGEFNSNIDKMMLTKHGYSDKQEIETNLKITDLSEDELDRKIQELEHQTK